ncbi:outer membrane efflux protein [Candidatus Koribacter versatilis Ellin345]|uniref:Outer membrane efflux protein n=1 Tax=Koribacter versatilis (strain Ellin345) TaxID=204669 RepID=Q1IQM1_KORVE|nr:TolC family protein [Candidatus Koribacter versatilis]ABF40829.1 outer membrane efflux protein [Candidatus Koribacter versatilis Ellin345]
MGHSFKKLALLSLLAATTLRAETVPFNKAIDAALKHSGTMAIAAAEEAHAQAGLQQARHAYIPNAVIGSGLGYSFGFPLTLEGAAPSILNFNTYSMLLNMPQREYIKSARFQWEAASSQTLDRRNQVILDTATAYFQLDLALSKLKVLKQQEDAAHKAEFITTQRVNEGVDSQLELKKSQLNSARARMKIAELQADVDVLRERLSKLTGIGAADFQTETQSLPKFPEVKQETDLASIAIANSPVVKAADQKAQAEDARAKAEHKQWMPTVDFAAQYAMLAKYNNYDEFYKKYERNNASIGLNIRFPIFSASQRDVAAAADADAIKAKKEAENARDQVTEQTLKLQRELAQISAAVDVAKLEYEIANTGVDAAQGRLESGNATARDVENARVDASDRFAAYLDAQLEYQKTQLQLMRATGEIYDWAATKK